MPPETTVVTSGGEDPSVLAEAAVASAAVAGAAAAQAADAHSTAEEAAAKADTALHVAASTPAGISPEEARRIAREEAEAYVGELAAAAKAAETEPAPATVEVTTTTVAPEVEPPSVTDANKNTGKKRWLHKYLGTDE